MEFQKNLKSNLAFMPPPEFFSTDIISGNIPGPERTEEEELNFKITMYYIYIFNFYKIIFKTCNNGVVVCYTKIVLHKKLFTTILSL